MSQFNFLETCLEQHHLFRRMFKPTKQLRWSPSSSRKNRARSVFKETIRKRIKSSTFRQNHSFRSSFSCQKRTSAVKAKTTCKRHPSLPLKIKAIKAIQPIQHIRWESSNGQIKNSE